MGRIITMPATCENCQPTIRRDGLTSAEIAEHLMLSVGTVKTHLQNVYPKLGANHKAAAVATALRHGLIH